ncbi:MAG: response regulator [Candidatus Cyclobacteriaceae bacterium M2_1C_046]
MQQQAKVLIFDDERDILEVTELALGRYYKVKGWDNVDNPVAVVKDFQPDLILMDIWIPEIGGEEATKRLKQDDETKDIPVVMFSANQEIQEIADRAGADGFIKKPFNLKALKEYIDTILSIRSMR